MDRQLGSLLKSLADSIAADLSRPTRPTAEKIPGGDGAELADTGGADAVELMHRLGLLPAAEAEPPPSPAGGAPPGLPGRIGIWELRPPAESGGAPFYQRSEASPGELDAWADVARLELAPGAGRRRVVLAGESVARGFMYDPRYTPAQVLEGLLTAAPGGVEVVDLARTGQTAQGLLELIAASLALRPAALILFAGNNWNLALPVYPDGIERQLVATVLRRHGVAGLKHFLDSRTAATIEATVQGALGQLARMLPIVLVVPEFNLADWRSELEADVPLLPGDGDERWLRLHAAARAARGAGQPQEAAALAQQMVELDSGTAASGWSILAEAAGRAGEAGKARELRERARDAHSWDNGLQVPRIHASVQQALRRSAAAAGVHVVDLPRLFAEEAPGGLPGRDLFLDYCHMSALGIRTAMAAVAERLLPLLGGAAASRQELLPRAVSPAPEVEGEAHLAAAIHNAHWGQGYDIVLHHCRQAASSPEVTRLMRDYLDLQVRRAPAWACTAVERLATRGASALSRFIFWTQQIGEDKLFDAVLLDAIADSLEETGTPARAALADLRVAERGLAPGRRLDLLEPYNLPSLATRERLWDPHFFYQAYTLSCRFPLVCAGGDPALLELTYRQPGARQAGAPAAGPVEDPGGFGALWINGTALDPLPMAAGWATRQILVPAGLLRHGVNWIEVRWPLRLPPAAAALDHQARRIEKGLPYCLLPVCGEIHSFTAALV
jgi:hypothetical protein